MDFFDNHNKLFGTAFLLFLVLTVFVALVPAMNNERNNATLPGYVPLSDEAVKGKALFVANGCVACHTQQVRNVDMDRMWGKRPGMAADYASNERTDLWRNTATLMGTERTGPDLTSVGTRQSSKEWNLVHLFNPRIVVKESIMPGYPWLFELKTEPSEKDIIVTVPEKYRKQGGTWVANKEALQLVAYLRSLQQTELPEASPLRAEIPMFLYKKEVNREVGEIGANAGPDGSALYAMHCQACHQANGEGLKGAFPALKGSEIVLNENPEQMLNIIIKGYDAQQEFGVMPAVATNAGLSPEEIAAIMNHERTSWGNNGKKISEKEVRKLLDKIKEVTNQ
jgi:cytochrome c oxidase cbb3-type subunit II